MWITIDESRVKGSAGLTGPELAAARTAALSSGVTDTLAETIDRVVREVRGYVSACGTNVLGPDGTIPDELETATLSRIVYELARRIPGKIILTQERKDANDNAIRLLERVSDCRFAIVPPEEEAEEQPALGGRPHITERDRVYRKEDGDGL